MGSLALQGFTGLEGVIEGVFERITQGSSVCAPDGLPFLCLPLVSIFRGSVSIAGVWCWSLPGFWCSVGLGLFAEKDAMALPSRKECAGLSSKALVSLNSVSGFCAAGVASFNPVGRRLLSSRLSSIFRELVSTAGIWRRGRPRFRFTTGLGSFRGGGAPELLSGKECKGASSKSLASST